MLNVAKTNTNLDVKTSKIPKQIYKLLKQFKKYMILQKRNIRKRKKYTNP